MSYGDDLAQDYHFNFPLKQNQLVAIVKPSASFYQPVDGQLVYFAGDISVIGLPPKTNVNIVIMFVLFDNKQDSPTVHCKPLSYSM